MKKQKVLNPITAKNAGQEMEDRACLIIDKLIKMEDKFYPLLHSNGSPKLIKKYKKLSEKFSQDVLHIMLDVV